MALTLLDTRAWLRLPAGWPGLSRWGAEPARPAGRLLIAAAACVLALVSLTYLAAATPLATTISGLALLPVLLAAWLSDPLLVAVVLTAAAGQAALALTGDLMPLTAAANTACALVAAAFGRLAAYHAARTRADRALLLALDEITEAALAGRPSLDMLRTVALKALELLGGDEAWIVMEGGRRGELTVAAAAGPRASRLEGLTFSRDGSLSGQVIDGAGTMLVRQSLPSTEGVEPLLGRHPSGWALLTPLPDDARCLGTLVVTGPSGRRALGRPSPAVSESLAARASLVILEAAAQEDRSRLAVCEDRARIARELHDGIIQSLLEVGVTIQLVRSSGRLGPSAADRLNWCALTLDESVDGLRRYVLGLQPPSRLLAEALSDMVERFRERTGIDARVEADTDALAALEAAAADVLQMVHEAMSNVERHARATRCHVRVHSAEASLLVEVADDGRGLEADGSGVHGLGLRNIRWRAARLGGAAQVRSVRDGGTTVRIALPVPQAGRHRLS